MDETFMIEQVDDIFPIKIDINPNWSKWKIYEPDKIIGSFLKLNSSECPFCDDVEQQKVGMIGLIISYRTIIDVPGKYDDFNEFYVVMSDGSFRCFDDVNLVYCTEKLEI